MKKSIFFLFVAVFTVSSCAFFYNNAPRPEISVIDTDIRTIFDEKNEPTLVITKKLQISNTSIIDLEILNTEYIFKNKRIFQQGTHKKNISVSKKSSQIFLLPIELSPHNMSEFVTLLSNQKKILYILDTKINFSGFFIDSQFQGDISLPGVDLGEIIFSEKSLHRLVGHTDLVLHNDSQLNFEPFTIHYTIAKITADGNRKKIYQNQMEINTLLIGENKIISIPFTLDTEKLVVSSQELVLSRFVNVFFEIFVDFGFFDLPFEKTYAISILE